MRTREAVSVAVAASWACGLVLILAGQPVVTAIAAFAAVSAAAIVFVRLRPGSRAWQRIRRTARRRMRSAPGGALERA